MNWKGFGRMRSWPNLRYYPRIRLEGQRKTTKTLIQVSRSPGRDLNMGPPEYEAVNHSTTSFGNALVTVVFFVTSDNINIRVGKYVEIVRRASYSLHCSVSYSRCLLLLLLLLLLVVVVVAAAVPLHAMEALGELNMCSCSQVFFRFIARIS
jgi:hypothetical protein